MDGALILPIGLLVWGGFLLREAVLQWQRAPAENRGWMEAGLLKLSGADKLPETWADRLLNRFRLMRKGVFGLLFFLGGGYLTLNELGAL